jgi:lipopolysaccharide transport system ATP-binding protein
MVHAVVIRAEGLGKKYTIGHAAERERYVALRDVMVRAACNLWHKTADMARGRLIVAGDSVEEFWALRDVSFVVRRGEVLGIIGRNGAGKSTLLKILSRITEPSEGRVTIKGRVASLLEVGTGFHPELTGRENIYLNGAILGMTRAEIRRKFDEIVAFAEVEKFLDTPVKRYSSGMYVRLAFAVAAHLEPEILVIDEVLAVGDAEFQKKCLGKISEVAGGGRTVLFVSHNMSAIRSLTERVLYLDRGRIVYNGSTEAALRVYAKPSRFKGTEPKPRGSGRHTRIVNVELLDDAGLTTAQYTSGTRMRFALTGETDGFPGLSFDLFLLDYMGTRIGMASSQHFHAAPLPDKPGRFTAVIELQPMWLASGTYYLDVATAVPHVCWDHYVENALEFECLFRGLPGISYDFRQDYGYGPCALLLKERIEFHPVAVTAAEHGPAPELL